MEVRRVSTTDEDALVAFLDGLSSESLHLRFFSAGISLRAMARRMISIGDEHGVGLIATTGADGRIIAHSMFALNSAGRAEVGCAVADDHHALGLATLMLGQLAEMAPVAVSRSSRPWCSPRTTG